MVSKMKTLILPLALTVFVTIPALADDSKKKFTAADRHERTQLWLEIRKRRTAAKADRLSGSDTFARALERRRLTQPKRHYRRTEYPNEWRELERLDVQQQQAREKVDRKAKGEAEEAARRERIRLALRNHGRGK